MSSSHPVSSRAIAPADPLASLKLHPSISPGRAELMIIRVYPELRAAHLERAKHAPGMYFSRALKYDLSGAPEDQTRFVIASVFGILKGIWRQRPSLIEITEPLWIKQLPLAISAAWVAKLRSRPGHQCVVATYAIENNEGLQTRSQSRKFAMRAIQMLIDAMAARTVDRIVFGTQGSKDLYTRLLPRMMRQVEHQLIPALPAPCQNCRLDCKNQGQLAFIGAFESRKGINEVMHTWSLRAPTSPFRRLIIGGIGPLTNDVQDWANGREDVTFLGRLSHSEVHEQLAVATALVLPSKRDGHWREQVGLPITEALAHGCGVITTDETGLASFLQSTGHCVIRASAITDELQQALDNAILPAANEVLGSLPDRDGRLEADKILSRQP